MLVSIHHISTDPPGPRVAFGGVTNTYNVECGIQLRVGSNGEAICVHKGAVCSLEEFVDIAEVQERA